VKNACGDVRFVLPLALNIDEAGSITISRFSKKRESS